MITLKTEKLFAILVVLLLSLNSFAGTTTKNLIKENVVSLEKVASNDGTIGGVSITQKGEIIIISGKVLMKTRHVRGHVDIGIYSPDGSLLHEFSTYANVRRVSRGRGRLLERTAHFKAEIPADVKKGTTFHIGFHKVNYNPQSTFQCRGNIAVN